MNYPRIPEWRKALIRAAKRRKIHNPRSVRELPAKRGEIA